MQTHNNSKSMQPKAGDGTQDVRRRQDANWFGQNTEPQEEFTADHLGEGGRHESIEPAKNEPKTETKP